MRPYAVEIVWGILLDFESWSLDSNGSDFPTVLNIQKNKSDQYMVSRPLFARGPHLIHLSDDASDG